LLKFIYSSTVAQMAFFSVVYNYTTLYRTEWVRIYFANVHDKINVKHVYDKKRIMVIKFIYDWSLYLLYKNYIFIYE
jgi:hypothetical protein